jgi:alkylation response protein AidB-like acyl-CoA dehydrogenase
MSGPLYQALRQWLPLVHGAFSVGLAEGTVDDLLALAHTGRQQLYAAGTLRDEDLMIEGARSAVWLATTCVGIADACFALAGSSAVYDSSPLQRRLRDVHVGAQHAHAQQRQYVDVGKLALRRSAGHAG